MNIKWWKEPAWHHEGADPDYRFSLANERTFLAWIRTALALIAGSVALVELVPSFTIPGARRGLGIAVAAAAAALASLSYRRWAANETAMRNQKGLPYSRLPAIIAVLATIFSLFIIVVISVK